MDPGYVPNIAREPTCSIILSSKELATKVLCYDYLDMGTLRTKVLTIFFIAILYADVFRWLGGGA